MKKKLPEIGFVGYPDDTGMQQRFSPQIKGKDYPYDMPGATASPMAPTEMQPTLQVPLTPKDVKHSVWDDALEEIGGMPMSLAKSSPGGMSRVTPGGNPWAGNPFDKEMSDKELEKAGHVREDHYDGHEKSFDSPPSDDELDQYQMSLGGSEYFPGSPFPSDIGVFGNDPFSQGLGMPTQSHRDLFGIMDGKGELPEKTVWAYIEQIVIGRITGK